MALLFPLAVNYEQALDHDKAIMTYQSILEQNPELDAAANNLAAILSDFHFDRPKSLERALKLADRFRDSDNPYYLDTLGWIHYRLGNLDQSLTFIEKAIKQQDAISQIQFHLGIVLREIGEYDRAREALRKALEENVEFPGVDQAHAALAELRKFHSLY